MDYQLVKFQCCRLSLASFIDRLRKNNHDIIMTLFDVVGIGKKFCATKYKFITPASFKSLSWSGSYFMEISIRHQKTPL